MQLGPMGLRCPHRFMTRDFTDSTVGGLCMKSCLPVLGKLQKKRCLEEEPGTGVFCRVRNRRRRKTDNRKLKRQYERKMQEV